MPDTPDRTRLVAQLRALVPYLAVHGMDVHQVLDAAAALAVEPDNHHNALLCPYVEFVRRCRELGAEDTDIVKHALEDQARIRTELVPLSIRLEEAEAALAAAQQQIAALERQLELADFRLARDK